MSRIQTNNIRKVKKRYTNYYELRYTVINEETNTVTRKSKYFHTSAEAQKFYHQIKSDVANHKYFESENDRITVGEWLDIWLDEYCKSQKYSTIHHYRFTCNNHIKPALGKIKLIALKTTQIQKFYNSLEQDNLAPKTIKNIHSCLSKALNVAIRAGYITSNPATNTEIKRATRKPIHPLDDEQVKQFLNALGDGKYDNVLRVILFTGLRESEAIGLTWNCIDFNNDKITIEKQLQQRNIADGGYTFESTKSDKIRVIHPAPTVMNILKAQRKKQITERMAAGKYWQGWQTEKQFSNSLCFLNEEGKHLSPKSLYIYYKKIVKDIAPETCVHDLRHTYATLSLQNGDDILTVSRNLGHATASFTLDVYGHISQKMRDNSANRMEAYIKNIEAV